ncbi:MAG: tetratricopeptide repeat protein [Myxococcota bacterium]|nr:tetratricopeptide repeat protein [Myxococcota bacterium]
MTEQYKNNLLLITWMITSIAIVGLYYSTLTAPFVYDDKIEVIGNRTIRFLDNWKAIATYNPSRMLLLFSYAFNFSRSAMEPFEYHVVNILIHSLSAGAALWMIHQIGLLAKRPQTLYPAIVVVSLWAVHPMCTESVSYITGRSESMCALFCFLTIGAWSQSLREGDHNPVLWKIITMLCMTAAALTKEVGLMLPFVLLLQERIFCKRIRWVYATPFFLLLFVGVAARVYTIDSKLGVQSNAASILQDMIPRESDRSLPSQLLTQAEVWLRYTALWFFPHDQTIYHHLPDRNPKNPADFLGALGWIAAAIGGWWSTRRNPFGRFALLTGFLLLLPSSSVAPLKENMAEHRAHQWGLYIFLYVATLLPQVFEKKRGLWILLISPVLMFLCYERNEIWKNEILLWEEAVNRNRKVGEAWYGLGDAYRFQGKMNDAEKAFITCVSLDPDYIDGWNNLGIVRAQIGDVRGARNAWKSALKTDPSYCKAHNNLGFLSARVGEWDDALTDFHSTLQYCPDNLLAHYALGEIYRSERFDRKKAIYYYERLLLLDSTFDKAEEVRKKLLELTW